MKELTFGIYAHARNASMTKEGIETARLFGVYAYTRNVSQSHQACLEDPNRFGVYAYTRNVSAKTHNISCILIISFVNVR